MDRSRVNITSVSECLSSLESVHYFVVVYACITYICNSFAMSYMSYLKIKHSILKEPKEKITDQIIMMVVTYIGNIILIFALILMLMDLFLKTVMCKIEKNNLIIHLNE